MTSRPIQFWFLHVPGWLLLAYLVYAQGISAIDYQIGVTLGTQEPASQITAVGAAFWYGFAFADLVIYIPLLAAGLAGHAAGCRWGRVVLAAALGITVYWPVTVLAAAVAARGAPGWTLDETEYWIVLPVILAWAAWALWHIAGTALTSSADAAS